MVDSDLDIPHQVTLTATSKGRDGLDWLAGLRGLVDELEQHWEIKRGRTLHGGTESFVTEVQTVDGQAAVLKLIIPGCDSCAREARTLLAAAGRGYVRLLRFDEARHALLLERLGPQLHELQLSIDTQIEIICATLQEVWRPPPEGIRLITGVQKAVSLAEFIESAWSELGKPCSERAIDLALTYAQIRGAAFDPEKSVLAHGDAHAWNTLLVPGEVPRRFKFIDPDGLIVERAYDVSILMREWSEPLLMGDPASLALQRCARLSALTGIAEKPIWEWGFLERVANSLQLKREGLNDLAEASIRVSDALAEVTPARAARTR
jgi:streptomycin 6-kinase